MLIGKHNTAQNVGIPNGKQGKAAAGENFIIEQCSCLGKIGKNQSALVEFSAENRASFRIVHVGSYHRASRR